MKDTPKDGGVNEAAMEMRKESVPQDVEQQRLDNLAWVTEKTTGKRPRPLGNEK